MGVSNFINKIFGNFIVNLFLGSYLAYLLFVVYNNSSAGKESGDLFFLIFIMIIYLLFPLLYSYGRLKNEKPSKYQGQTLIFTLSMLFFEPFVTALIFMRLGFPAVAGASDVVEFAFFIAELFAFIPLLIGYSIISRKIGNKVKEI